MFVLLRLRYNTGYNFFTGFCFLCEELKDFNMLDLVPTLTAILK